VEQHNLNRTLAAALSGLLLAAVPVFAARPLGIDVSHYQGTGLNWSTIKNTNGISFAWTKSTEGFTYNDDTFTTNEVHAASAGVYIGAYHYARPDNQVGLAGADQEAAHYWSIASPYIKSGNKYLMPMLDVEQDLTGAGYTKTTLSQWVNRWCTDIQNYGAAAGLKITPVVYTYISYASTWLDSTVAQNWPLWMANYNGANPQTGAPNAVSPWATWQFWQYNDAAASGGDSDTINGDANTLKDYIIGSPGRFNDGARVQTTAALKAWNSAASNGTFATEPLGTLGTILQGPIYGASYQRWQIRYADGTVGWSAEDFLTQVADAVPGDFNLDGRVDATDYVLWRNGQSPTPNSATDYDAWRTHFGQSNLGSGSGLATSSVPEPISAVYLWLAPLFTLMRRRRT
jgi:GH25 family lysozyme M1 (1,4-beta-N-acetylmuramidase)